MTKLDIYNADSEVCRASADVINRILAADGMGQTIAADEVYSLGCAAYVNNARYYANACKRFTIVADLVPTKGRYVLALNVIDGRTQHATRETVKL
jgi:hypothetical protein